MQSARAGQSLPAVVPGRSRRRAPDRRTLRRVAAGLCLLLALYCVLAAAVSLAQTPAGSDPGRSPAPPRDRLPLLIPLIFLVFLVVTVAVVRRRGHPATGPPESPSRRPRRR